ncbi:hypothetical protein [Frigoriglobus tundricola]|uniref:hypothetical protein n=1 Tax=Frigoriglobus tundricola TaxID=2774151 RepID=UPI001D0912F6|nr:hypothetical protein [Frigoriglobus tundricola]
MKPWPSDWRRSKKELAELKRPAPKQDWRRVIGLSEENEFTRQVQVEIEANSEAERRAALKEHPE